MRVSHRRSNSVIDMGLHIQPGERFNTYTHLVGLGLTLFALPITVAKTLPEGNMVRTAAALVFAVSCVGLYAASTLFHGARGAARMRWQRVDHCAIYTLIAGSYTPFALLAVRGISGWLLLAAVWGLAIFGIARELSFDSANPPLALYLGMGWLGVGAAGPLVAHAEAGALAWLLLGAMSYTAGTIFYVNRAGYRHAHGFWHLFVMGGATSHYIAIASFVL